MLFGVDFTNREALEARHELPYRRKADDHISQTGQGAPAENRADYLATARSIDPDQIPDKAWDLSFREELHAIDAVVAGQGIAICSDVVVGRELEDGSLVKAHPLSLPGYGFYVVWLHHSPRSTIIESFLAWTRTVL